MCIYIFIGNEIIYILHALRLKGTLKKHQINNASSLPLFSLCFSKLFSTYINKESFNSLINDSLIFSSITSSSLKYILLLEIVKN